MPASFCHRCLILFVSMMAGTSLALRASGGSGHPPPKQISKISIYVASFLRVEKFLYMSHHPIFVEKNYTFQKFHRMSPWLDAQVTSSDGGCDHPFAGMLLSQLAVTDVKMLGFERETRWYTREN